MIIPADFTWNEDDAVAIRTFLHGNPRFIMAMENLLPPITGATMEQRAVTGSDANGYLLALRNIGLLATGGMQMPKPDSRKPI